jgi:hypothetical protein
LYFQKNPSFLPDLQLILEKNLPDPYQHACRRFSSNHTRGTHHGFFESNQNPNALPRSWQLYQHSSPVLLQHLKPFLQFLETWYRKGFPKEYTIAKASVAEGLGLFDTLFTAVVVNLGGCEWHIDPEDKQFTFIFYLGDFSQGELLLGPPLNKKIPVQSTDLVGICSHLLFHKAQEAGAKQNRWAISCYVKTKRRITQQGEIIILPQFQKFLEK